MARATPAPRPRHGRCTAPAASHVDEICDDGRMRAGWIVVALVACHHPEAPVAVAPRGPTPCARAADSMVQTMLERLPKQDAPPTEEADALRNLIRERCEQDAWSADAARCLIAMKTTEDAAPCADLMTDAQQAALVRDQQALFGAAPAASAAGGGAAPADASGATGGGAAPADASGAASPASPGAAGGRQARDKIAPMPEPAQAAPPAPVSPARRPSAKKTKGNGVAGDPCSGGE
jgi:hypothetical protein